MSVVGVRLRMDSLSSTESSSDEESGELVPVDMDAPGVKHLRYASDGQTTLEVAFGENRDVAVSIPTAAVRELEPEEAVPGVVVGAPSEVLSEAKAPSGLSAFSVIGTDAAPRPREGITVTRGRIDPAAAKASATEVLLSLVSSHRAAKKRPDRLKAAHARDEPEGDAIKKMSSAAAVTHSQRDRRTDIRREDEDHVAGVRKKRKKEDAITLIGEVTGGVKTSDDIKFVPRKKEAAFTLMGDAQTTLKPRRGTKGGRPKKTKGKKKKKKTLRKKTDTPELQPSALIFGGTAIGVGVETDPGIGAVTEIVGGDQMPHIPVAVDISHDIYEPSPAPLKAEAATASDYSAPGYSAPGYSEAVAVASGRGMDYAGGDHMPHHDVYDVYADEDQKHYEDEKVSEPVSGGGGIESERVPTTEPFPLPPPAACWKIYLAFMEGWVPIEPESEQISLEAGYQRWLGGGRSDPESQNIMFRGKGGEDMRVKLSTMSTLMGVMVQTIEPIPKEPVTFSSEKYVVHDGCYVESCNIGRFPYPP